jgi:hypothetical protein
MSYVLAADAIDVYYRVGIIVGPLLGLLVGLYFSRHRFRGGRESAERAIEELKRGPRYPVASNCPSCGSREYQEATDQENQLILVYDRICSRCETRYTPPTPKRVALGMFPLGALLIAFGVLLPWYAGPATGIPGLLLLIGLAVVVSGVHVIFIGVAKVREGNR